MTLAFPVSLGTALAQTSPLSWDTAIQVCLGFLFIASPVPLWVPWVPDHWELWLS